MRSLGRGGPSPQSEGVPGSLGPSALPSFPAVGVLPVVLSRRGSAAALPRSPPARRGRSRAARTSRLRRLRSRRRRPRASLPPGSGECLAAVASGAPPRPSIRPSASVHSRAPVSVLSVVPRAPFSVPLLPLLCPQPGRASAPSFPRRLLCVPAATGPSPLGLRSASLCSLGCENPTVSAVREPPRPRGRYGILEAVPPTPRLGGTGHPVTLRSPPVVCRLLRRPV